jgi:hypothetical protein
MTAANHRLPPQLTLPNKIMPMRRSLIEQGQLM